MFTKLITVGCLIAVLLIQISMTQKPLNEVSTQNSRDNWRVFVSSDKSFSIEVPERPVFSRKAISEEDEEWLDLFTCTRSVSFYKLKIKTSAPDIEDKLTIGVIDASGCRKSREVFLKEVKDNFAVLGDDEKKVELDVDLKISGRVARLLVYSKGEATGGRFLVIRDAKRIYMLAYRTETMNDDLMTKKKIDRIFNSFRLK